MNQEKACTKCSAIKPLLDYPIRSSRPDGHGPWCFPCQREYDREYRAKNIDRVRRNGRRWKRSDSGRSKAGDAALLTKYGLTREAFEAKLAAQGGKCTFCPPDAEPLGIWAVDHDHECCAGQQTCGGCLRDILCQRHNVGLGLFGDDPELLRAAADYVERWRERIRAAGTTPWQAKPPRKGADHPSWRGSDVNPAALRTRVWRELGTADHCINGCNSPGRYEWVCPTGADPESIAAYVPMCRSCSTAHHGLKGAGHPKAALSAEQVAEIRARYVRGRAPSQWDLAREYGVTQGTISLIVRGERYVT